MPLSKKDLLRIGVENQDALVKRLQEQKTIPPKKHIIPGGKNLFETLDQDNMSKAIYNWLRACRAFTEVTISFAKNPDKFRCSSSRVREFDGTGNRLIWESDPRGKQVLAEQLADIINTHKAIKVTAKKEGIWVYTDVENQFSPVYEITEEDVAAQAAAVEEEKQRLIELGRDPEELQWHPLSPGDTVPSEDWEPFIEFIPKRKQEYGR